MRKRIDLKDIKGISAKMSAKMNAQMDAMSARAMRAPIERPTIVLFDMDGTTVRHVSPRFIAILEFLDDMSYKFSNMLARRKPVVDVSAEPVQKKSLIVRRTLHKLYRKPVEQVVEPCPGIFSLLDFFRDNKIPLGIVSNSLGKGYGHDILEKFNLEPYFEAQIFKEDIEKSKPHPDPILRGLRAMDIPPTADDIVWYIGDRHKDVKAALAANKLSECKITPFSYGINAAMAILQNNVGTDHIIMNYHDFYERLQGMFSNSVKT